MTEIKALPIITPITKITTNNTTLLYSVQEPHS